MEQQAAFSSKKIASAAIKLALSESREEERELKRFFGEAGIRAAAVDFGGETLAAIPKIIERAIVAAKREGVIKETHAEEGSVAGATHEAISQVVARAVGLNIGGKIGIARYHDHVSVAIFFAIGMSHLDDVAIGLAHRAVANLV
ncbi:MAG: HutP family protein [Clostridiales bacterium]|nr:HutP family protein [Clostridiales bacterium]